ncbi:TPA: hypothetical protein ACH3X2_005745 [Trebouxia sp. C0005]
MLQHRRYQSAVRLWPRPLQMFAAACNRSPNAVVASHAARTADQNQRAADLILWSRPSLHDMHIKDSNCYIPCSAGKSEAEQQQRPQQLRFRLNSLLLSPPTYNDYLLPAESAGRKRPVCSLSGPSAVVQDGCAKRQAAHRPSNISRSATVIMRRRMDVVCAP